MLECHVRALPFLDALAVGLTTMSETDIDFVWPFHFVLTSLCHPSL